MTAVETLRGRAPAQSPELIPLLEKAAQAAANLRNHAIEAVESSWISSAAPAVAVASPLSRARAMAWWARPDSSTIRAYRNSA